MVLSAKASYTDAHIYGHVIDKTTGEHLPYVVIMLKGTTIGVTTENTGHYMIRNVPEGKFTLEASAIGYKTQTREIEIRKGNSYEVNFILEEDLVQIDGVIVSATRSETTRRMSPTLVNVIGMDTYSNANNYGRSNSHCNSNPYCNRYTHTGNYGYSNRYRYSNTNGNAYRLP